MRVRVAWTASCVMSGKLESLQLRKLNLVLHGWQPQLPPGAGNLACWRGRGGTSYLLSCGNAVAWVSLPFQQALCGAVRRFHSLSRDAQFSVLTEFRFPVYKFTPPPKASFVGDSQLRSFVGGVVLSRRCVVRDSSRNSSGRPTRSFRLVQIRRRAQHALLRAARGWALPPHCTRPVC